MKNVAIMGKQSVRQTGGGASITDKKEMYQINQSIYQAINRSVYQSMDRSSNRDIDE